MPRWTSSGTMPCFTRKVLPEPPSPVMKSEASASRMVRPSALTASRSRRPALVGIEGAVGLMGGGGGGMRAAIVHGVTGALGSTLGHACAMRRGSLCRGGRSRQICTRLPFSSPSALILYLSGLP
eukprot:3191877-Pleurochrysis_carterae.AAC.1